MAHSDDQGLVLPPRIAPLQVVIIPVYKGPESVPVIDQRANNIVTILKQKGISVKFDTDDTKRPGWKFAEYELKGVPIRVALGLRDIENNQVEVARRDTREKSIQSLDDIEVYIEALLQDIQASMFAKAKTFRDGLINRADTWEEFVKLLEEKGGFVSAHWDGTTETEAWIKEKTKATIRCIPLNNVQETGKCIVTGKLSKERVLFAKAY
jgi:prolyl-tRNA synthetase